MSHNKRKIDTLNFSKQILIILLPICAFLTSAAIDKINMWNFYETQFISIIVLDLVYLGGWCYWSHKKVFNKSFKFNTVISAIMKNGWIIFALIYTVGIRLVQFSDIQRWDASIYYGQLILGCNNFDFTFTNFIKGFGVASHPTWGYLGILGIGEFLATGKCIGMYTINLILTLLCVYCLYRILQSMLPERSEKYIALSTCILSSLPLFAGTFSYCNPDMGVALFTILMIYCFIFNQRILMFFSMLLLITSKETGILMVGGFGFGIFIWRFSDCKENMFRRIRYALREPLCLFSAVLGVAGTISLPIFWANGGKIWSSHSESKPEFSTITFIPEFIWNNIKQFYLLNFNWISTILIILCIILAFKEWSVHKRFYKKLQNMEALAGVIGGYIVNILFYSLYITFTLARYHVIIDIIWTLIMLLMVGRFFSCKIVRNFFLGCFCVLLIIQAYITVDPISIYSFLPHDTGNSIILTTQHMRKDLDTIAAGDYNVYNHHYAYIDKAIEQILRLADYREDMDIISDSPQEMKVDGVYWDTENKKLTYSASESTISISAIHGNSVNDTNGKEKAIFIFFPQNGGDMKEVMEHVRWYYKFSYGGNIDIKYGGKLYYLVGEKL